MIRLVAIVICLAGLSMEAFADGYCSWQAQEIMQKMGGEQLTLSPYSRVDGWGVNAFGYESYQFVRGNEVCAVSYTVKGTYFGMNCSFSWGDGPSCSVPGKRVRRR